LADDWTGAGDVGLAFWRAGFETALWAPVGGPPRPPRNARVWVIDTESRHLPPAAAARRVRAAVRVLRAWGATFFYKKIDSTLRGPVGPELKAFLDATGPGGAPPVVPAHPRLGRVTRGGVHYVNGVPLKRSAAGRDPRAPVAASRIARLLGQAPAPKLFRVPDVESVPALNALARGLIDAGGTRAVGASALAGALARLWGRPRARPRCPAFSRWVVVSGSAHPASRAQATFLAKRLGRSGERRKTTLLAAPVAPGRAERIAADLRGRARNIERTFSRAVRRRTGWWIAGGETAFGLVRSWKTPAWRVAGAMDEGVALCRAEGPESRWLVTKPGGFGRPDLLWRVLGK
jgi:uncharacterized protein YgbK (DUF1537 family)